MLLCIHSIDALVLYRKPCYITDRIMVLTGLLDVWLCINIVFLHMYIVVLLVTCQLFCFQESKCGRYLGSFHYGYQSWILSVFTFWINWHVTKANPLFPEKTNKQIEPILMCPPKTTPSQMDVTPRDGMDCWVGEVFWHLYVILCWKYKTQGGFNYLHVLQIKLQ